MSATKYVYMPWLRQGLASAIAIDDGADVPGAQRAPVHLKLKINQKEDVIEKDVQLYGPGDVVGVDRNVVVRTDPKNNVGDFEPNYFPMVEFAEADFPWMMTPARQVNDRLRPWVGLVVLRAEKTTPTGGDEETELEPEYDETRDASRPAPFITVKSQRQSLPDPAELWRWAHVQVTGDDEDALSDGNVGIIMKENPERIISRIVCARRLLPGVLYGAFLVPTFETGRKAGLGEPVDAVSLQAPAWDTANDGPVDLPYYFRWEFRTGLRGDFEYLVRLLEARPLDNRVGKRNIDCTDPGLGISPPEENTPYVLGLEGALRHLSSETEACDPDYREQLRLLLNQNEGLTVDLSDPATRPRVLPEIYAKYHALIDRLENGAPGWIKEINLDPRQRATAGFGVGVVRRDQENLVHEAWRQAGAVEEANQRIREAQMAALINDNIIQKKLAVLPQNYFLQLASPLHAKISAGPALSGNGNTVKGYLNDTVLPAVVFDPSFRRAFRKRGIVRRRQREDGQANRKDLLSRMNEGEVQGAGPARRPDGAGSLETASEAFRPSWARGPLWAVVKYAPVLMLILSIVGWITMIILKLCGVGVNLAHPVVLSVQGALLVLFALLLRLGREALIADTVREGSITPEFLGKAQPPADFPEPEKFRAFARAMQSFLMRPPAEPPRRAPADLGTLHSRMLEQLHPETNLHRKLLTRFALPGSAGGRPTIAPVMAHPEFSHPMYKALAELSQDYLLPGLEYVQQNTLTLLRTNQAFVEAFMTGCNAEFAGELLWREYPTDLRCTCFRQFWDVSETVRPARIETRLRAEVTGRMADEIAAIEDDGEKEAFINARIDEKWKEMLLDIKPIHEWRNSPLGRNRSVVDPDLEDKLVVLVRGDLLKKYPNTVIYALKAVWENDGGRDVRRPDFSVMDAAAGGDSIEFPVLKGSLKPDITFLGFNLTEAEVRGSTDRHDDGGTVENDAGWFFVIEERVSESRFGMDSFLQGEEMPDAITEWDDLSWGLFFAKDAEGHIISRLSEAGYIDGAEPRHNVLQGDPGAEPGAGIWGRDAAHMALITFQKPVRIAVHADDMLPESSG
ncbi:MAG: hypothetical protein JXD23_02385 [Spirochaetales bacterium]|nr:hypothetical protein [Spirochaetales bacterium]